MDRWQVPLYLAGLAAGAVIGLLLPSSAGIASALITPALAALLFVTFLGIPFAGIREAARDRRFLATLLVLDFVIVPAVVLGLTRFLTGDRVLLVGVLFVLLTPCIDYVVVFTGLAGGDTRRLVAATPVLMVVQMLLLPVFLAAFAGAEVVAALDPVPFVSAFVLLIVLPALAAWLTQTAAARFRAARPWPQRASGLMVPLMVITLAAVVASRVAEVAHRWTSLVAVVPVFLGFALAMTLLGIVIARLVRLDPSGSRALVLSGVTRNSLVVLPLVLALPPSYSLAPLVVVTQTFVELIVMIVLVALLPRWIRDDARRIVTN